jgi:hypothetical protein
MGQLSGLGILPGEPPPAPTRVVAGRAGDGPAHHRLDIVKRRVGLAGRRHPQRVVRIVGTGVPPVTPEIEAADEGDLIVDHHHLLVE